MRPLVLGLGNDLLADDAVGILAARALKKQLSRKADIVESSLAGLALLEQLVGYQQAVIIDAVQTGCHPPGTVLELDPQELAPVVAPSPHYAGLPEVIALAQRLELDFPQDLAIFAMEVQDPYTIGGGLTPAVQDALPELVDKVVAQVARWERAPAEPQPA